MTLRLSLYTPPAAEPVHLTEAKIHLRLAVDSASAVAYTNEDALLSRIISASRRVAEVETWKSQVLQTWDFFLDCWPDGDEIELPFPPLRQVLFIKYTDSDGVESTMDTATYDVDLSSTPGRVVLANDENWPVSTLRSMNPVHIRFTCGYIIPFSVSTSTDVVTALNHPFVNGDSIRLSVSGGILPTGVLAKTDYIVNNVVDGVSFKLTGVDFTTSGSGSMFVGEIPDTTIAGMLLVLTDLYEERADTVISRNTSAIPANIPRAATHFFAMDSAKGF
jgi:uncharacterized phiE125 gp8 family phage protein